jgi:hypothetical protein
MMLLPFNLKKAQTAYDAMNASPEIRNTLAPGQ